MLHEKKVCPCDEKTLLKHKKCASLIGSTIYKGEFYLCSSMDKPNYTLCKHCVETCHDGHEHTLLSKGSYECFCARDDHTCIIAAKDENVKNCFYQDLFKETPNEGFYYLINKTTNKSRTFCAICADKCEIEGYEDLRKEQVKTKEDELCECPNHKARNAFLIFQDFKNKNKSKNKGNDKVNKKFTMYLKNFNFNIMLKNDNVNAVTGTVLKNALGINPDKQSGNEKKIDALTDPNTQAVLELFGVFSLKWKNKFFYCEPEQFHGIYEKVMEVIEKKQDLTATKEEQYESAKNKLRWINLLFSMFIRKEWIDNNNLWSLNTIQNMNISQRMKYIIKKERKDNGKAAQIITLLLELFEKTMNDSTSSDEDFRIYQELFPFFNKMMKFSIKFHIATDKQAIKYFQLVQELLMKYKDYEIEKEEKKQHYLKRENERKEKEKKEEEMKEKKGIGSLQTGILKTCHTKFFGDLGRTKEERYLERMNIIEDESSSSSHPTTRDDKLNATSLDEDPYQLYQYSNFLIIKAMFYYLLYRNDNLVLTPLTDDHEFIFTEQSDNNHQQVMEAIKTIFYTILSKPLASTTDEVLAIESIVSKIFNLMTKNDFYVHGLNNLCLLTKPNSATQTIQGKIKGDIDGLIGELRHNARGYFTYKLNYRQYADIIDEIMTRLQTVIEKYVKLDDLSNNYLSFIKDDDSQDVKNNTRALQEAVKDTNLFQAMEEIIHISGFASEFIKAEEAKKSFKNKDKNKDDTINRSGQGSVFCSPSYSTRKFMLQLYFVLISNNQENLCLFMNLKSKPFVVFFTEITEEFFNFYYRFIEVLYSSPYHFASNKFIKATLLDFVNTVVKKKKNINETIKDCSALFRILNLLLSKDSTEDVIEYGSSYSKLFPIKRSSELKEKFFAYLSIEPNDNGRDMLFQGNNEFIADIAEALMNFADLAGTMEALDIKKFIPITGDSPENLLPYQLIPDIITDFISKPKAQRLIDVKVIFPLLKYYINKTLPFNIHIADNDKLISCCFHQLSDNPQSGEESLSQRANRLGKSQMLSNVSLINICRDFSGPNSKTGNIEAQITRLFSCFTFLGFLADKYDIILRAYLDSPSSFKSVFDLKLVLYHFLQDIFIKPLYYYIKVLEIYLPYIEGLKFEALHQSVFKVLRAVYIFYKNINDIGKPMKEGSKDNDGFIDPKYYNLFMRKDFWQYEQLDINRKLNEFDKMTLIHGEVINIGASKFFQVKDYVAKLENCLNHIIIFGSKENEEDNEKDKEKEKEGDKGKNEMIKKSFKQEDIENIVRIYIAAMDKGSQFVVFPSKISVENILSSNYFPLSNKSSMQLQLVDIEKIEYFINIMKSISDIKYGMKPQQKIEVGVKLKQYASKELIEHFLKLICFTNIVEMTKMFHLSLAKDTQKENLNSFINQTLTQFFQILCEGNNITMKDYLFNQSMPIIMALATSSYQKSKQESAGKGKGKDNKAQGKEKGKGKEEKNSSGKKGGKGKEKEKEKDGTIKEEDEKDDEKDNEEDKTKQRKILHLKKIKFQPQKDTTSKDESITQPTEPEPEPNPSESSSSITNPPQPTNESVRSSLRMKNASRFLIHKKNDSSSNPKEEFDPKNKATFTFASVTQEVATDNRLTRAERLKQQNDLILKNQGNFFNIICTNMKMIFLKSKEYQNPNLCLTNQLYSKTKDKIYLNPNDISKCYTNLLIEMIQGYNFTEDIFSNYSDVDVEPPFAFFYLCREINGLMLNTQGSLDLTLIDYKINLFTIVVNILNQKFNFKKAKFLNNFNVMKLMNLLSFYIRYLYLKFCDRKGEEDIEKEINSVRCTGEMLARLIAKYKNDNNIYNDKIFKLSEKIYTFLRILKDKYRNRTLINSMDDSSKTFDERINSALATIQKRMRDNEKEKEKEKDRKKNHDKKEESGMGSIDDTRRKASGGSGKGNAVAKKVEVVASRQEVGICGRIFAYKFFEKIIKQIEICVPVNNKLQPKNVLFLIEPSTYLFNDKELEKCFANVDRSSRRTKLFSIIDLLPDIVQKINYKNKHPTSNTPFSQWLHNFNFGHIDAFNCLFAIIINCTFLGLLDRNQTSLVLLGNVSFYMEIILITVNLIALGVYLYTKFLPNGNLLWEKADPKTKKYFPFTALKVYLCDSFLFHEDVKTMILITIFGILGITTKYDILLFTLQLFTIGTFIPTIQEIIDAFRMRYDQLVSMVFFLGIVTFFFANYDYYFLKEQFITEQDTGAVINSCSTLLECYLTLFNNGVRSGGGIGDILLESTYANAGYYERWVHDAIFFLVVILLLLNMINGVIVTTFGQLREESTAKEEDMTTTCFICQIAAFELEKQNKTFKHHYKEEHNIKCYVRYLASLLLMNDNDMDQDQYFVYNCIEEKSVDFFPFHEQNEEDAEDNNEDDGK